MKTSVLAFSTVLSFPAAALAAVCVENNTLKCADLGYTESSCPYGGIACPFDISRWYCAKWTCEDGRYLSSPRTDVECIAVTYKDMTCYDCERKCTDGTYETYEACMGMATSVTLEISTTATATSLTTSTVSESSTSTVTTGFTCRQNSSGCWERQYVTAVTCPAGYYTSRELCLTSSPISTSETCVEDSNGCWYRTTITPDQCSDGYAKTAALCGSTGEEGWYLDMNQSDPEGISGCYKCVENTLIVSQGDIAVSPACGIIFPAASAYYGAQGDVRYYSMDCGGYGYLYNCGDVDGCCQNTPTYNGKQCRWVGGSAAEQSIPHPCCDNGCDNWYRSWNDDPNDCIENDGSDPYYSPGLNSGFISCRRLWRCSFSYSS